MALKWATMTKEQRQVAGFSAFCVLAVLYGAYVLGIKPALGKTDVVRNELGDVELTLRKMGNAIKQEHQDKDAAGVASQQLRTVGQDFMPDSRDPLSWASEFLGRASREVGIVLSRVEGRGVKVESGKNTKFATYGVTVSIKCTYFEALKFIELLRSLNEYTLVSELSIKGSSDKELHGVRIVFEWPVWKSPELEMKLDS